MSELDDFMVHTVIVRTLTGSGGMGQTFADPVDVVCFVDDQRRLVRDTHGAEIVSESTVLDVDTAHAATWAPGSLVTLPSGREATVITCAVRTSGDLDLPDHLEVSLT